MRQSSAFAATMHVIETLLPLERNDGSRQPTELYEQVRREMVEKFGGLTAYSRAPAEGLWERAEGEVNRDSIVIFEVMADSLDHSWWRDFRSRLEALFEQEEIVIRSSRMEQL